MFMFGYQSLICPQLERKYFKLLNFYIPSAARWIHSGLFQGLMLPYYVPHKVFLFPFTELDVNVQYDGLNGCIMFKAVFSAYVSL